MSRRDDEPPIWARPEPPAAAAAALSRAQIVRVALAIADAEGLEAVSIRRLARELRTGAMSIYHYFDSRDELLELMGETVAAEMLLARGAGRLARRAEGDRAAQPRRLQAPPVAAGHAPGAPAREPNMLRHVEQSSQARAAARRARARTRRC